MPGSDLRFETFRQSVFPETDPSRISPTRLREMFAALGNSHCLLVQRLSSLGLVASDALMSDPVELARVNGQLLGRFVINHALASALSNLADALNNPGQDAASILLHGHRVPAWAYATHLTQLTAAVRGSFAGHLEMPTCSQSMFCSDEQKNARRQAFETQRDSARGALDHLMSQLDRAIADAPKFTTAGALSRQIGTAAAAVNAYLAANSGLGCGPRNSETARWLKFGTPPTSLTADIDYSWNRFVLEDVAAAVAARTACDDFAFLERKLGQALRSKHPVVSIRAALVTLEVMDYREHYGVDGKPLLGSVPRAVAAGPSGWSLSDEEAADEDCALSERYREWARLTAEVDAVGRSAEPDPNATDAVDRSAPQLA